MIQQWGHVAVNSTFSFSQPQETHPIAPGTSPRGQHHPQNVVNGWEEASPYEDILQPWSCFCLPGESWHWESLVHTGTPLGPLQGCNRPFSRWCWAVDLVPQNLSPHCALAKIYKPVLANYTGSAVLKDLLSLCLLSLLFCACTHFHFYWIFTRKCTKPLNHSKTH